MSVSDELENYINDFNESNNTDFDIDTIRIEFSKEHKLKRLKELGKWKQIHKGDKKILAPLKKRLEADEITTAYKLENHNIYYYNSKEKNYRIATMVIFGLKQYHKAPPPRGLTDEILNIFFTKSSKLKQNIDVCLDLLVRPNIEKLKNFTLNRYYKNGTPTDTYYINNPKLLMIEKIVIYDKAYKNDLGYPLWRVEAKIIIPNIKMLCLPLEEFNNQIVNFTSFFHPFHKNLPLF